MRQAIGSWGLVLCLLVTNVCAGDMASIILPKPHKDGGQTLVQALEGRQSLRQFASTELSHEDLADVLWAANGVNRPDIGGRTAPSAMNCQEIDIYVAREDGVYLYDAKKHSLEPVMAGDMRPYAGKQAFMQDAPIALIYVADFARMKGMPEEKDRHFYAATDTGFVSQNVYLMCASRGLSTVVIGWVDREGLKKGLKLRDDQHVILTQPVGYPRQ